MPKPIDHNKVTRLYHSKENNVAYESAHTTKLRCGHVAHGYPLAIYANRKGLYVCPEGCGLQKASTR